MGKILASLLLMAGLAAGCGSSARNATTATSSAPAATVTTTTTTVTAGPSPTVPAPVATTAAATTTVPGPTAYDQLAPFIRAAQKMDLQLSTAARLINGAGPPWTQPLPATVSSAVQAADLAPVAATIPAGLPRELLRRTVLVYSDLASRRYSIRWFGPEGFPYEESNPQAQSLLMEALANGAPAAARFPSDLAGLAGAARTVAPFTQAGSTSRAEAELLLLVQLTDMANGGCASTGGQVLTTLPAIVWAPHDDVSGTISNIDFKAQIVDGAWRVTILAC